MVWYAYAISRGPDHHTTIDTASYDIVSHLNQKEKQNVLTAEGAHSPVGFFMNSNGVHSVLMGGLELSVC